MTGTMNSARVGYGRSDHNPRSQAFESPAVRQPAKDRFEESEKGGVHQEVDGDDEKHKGFEYAAQARFSSEPKRESSLSSRAKAANYTTAMEPLFSAIAISAFIAAALPPRSKLGSRPLSAPMIHAQVLFSRISEPGADGDSDHMIEFPNHSRSYDRTGHAVRFWGHDSAIEASFS
jgi:hypothetical protein